ncbi:Non-histone chromosomal protein 6 [Spiromyces aspiralis]|uniref:Non-histone chromosomal protein 6 n=1 Tax=Spiromyces aspiralis TaxID=68401 RepID=A0ACC1HP66_9FUNG|nr:Non-histone chromosomal protein 6 [Spiromyces aspiralis]
MSETEKQPYVLMMEESKRDHERVLRDWWQSVDRDLVALENARRRRQNKLAEEQGTGRKLRLLSDPFAPKRPLTAYMLWSNEMRQKSGKISTVSDMAALQRELGARWRNMSESEKKPYYDQFKETQDRYKQQVAKYMSK